MVEEDVEEVGVVEEQEGEFEEEEEAANKSR